MPGVDTDAILWARRVIVPHDLRATWLTLAVHAEPEWHGWRVTMTRLCYELQCDPSTARRHLAYLERVDAIAREHPKGGPGAEQVIRLRMDRTPQELYDAMQRDPFQANSRTHARVTNGATHAPMRGLEAATQAPVRELEAKPTHTTIAPVRELAETHAHNHRMDARVSETHAHNYRTDARVELENPPHPPEGSIRESTGGVEAVEERDTLNRGTGTRVTQVLGEANASPRDTGSRSKADEKVHKQIGHPAVQKTIDAMRARGLDVAVLAADRAALVSAWNTRQDKNGLPELVANCIADVKEGVYGQPWLANNLSVHTVVQRLPSYETWVSNGRKRMPSNMPPVRRNGSANHSGRAPVHEETVNTMYRTLGIQPRDQ